MSLCQGCKYSVNGKCSFSGVCSIAENGLNAKPQKANNAMVFNPFRNALELKKFADTFVISL